MLILIFLILIKYSLESKAEINYLSETNNDLKQSDRETRWLGSWGDGGGDGGFYGYRWRGRYNWGRYNWGRQYGWGGRYYWG
ncbi:unnamed protein product [Meloidogyne enterolobii]|uniref:Uncharacterized protein n=1 Tax=Meloidogyne enterolobii TaxID=390850 RepID=A0ACB1A583_MELEN